MGEIIIVMREGMEGVVHEWNTKENKAERKKRKADKQTERKKRGKKYEGN